MHFAIAGIFLNGNLSFFAYIQSSCHSTKRKVLQQYSRKLISLKDVSTLIKIWKAKKDEAQYSCIYVFVALHATNFG